MKKIASLSTAGLFLFLLVLFVLRSANADSLNLETGEYLMDMGDGDMMNLETGED